MNKLTVSGITALTKPGRYPDGAGGYVQLSPSGGLSFLFRYKSGGKQHWMGCGALDRADLAGTLAAARQRAADARNRLAGGEDPLEYKRALAAALAPSRAMKFREVALSYIATHGTAWKNAKHRKQWDMSLNRYILPAVGKLDVRDVTVAHVKQILGPVWTVRPETARRTRGRLELILDFAAAHGYRSPENPARHRLAAQMLGRARPPVAHHPALPYTRLPELWTKLEARDDIPALALQWTIVTGVRSQEGRGALWTEVDKTTWTVSAGRMKRGKPHRVPLSTAALGVLERAKPARGRFIFPGQKEDTPISDTALRSVLRDCGITKEMGSVHGMRSSMRDYMADIGIEEPVAEACLAHAVPGKVLAAYRRTDFYDKRATAMDKWGDCLSFG